MDLSSLPVVDEIFENEERDGCDKQEPNKETNLYKVGGVMSPPFQ